MGGWHGAADALINLGAVCPECGGDLRVLPEWGPDPVCGSCWLHIEFVDDPLGDPK